MTYTLLDWPKLIEDMSKKWDAEVKMEDMSKKWNVEAAKYLEKEPVENKHSSDCACKFKRIPEIRQINFDKASGTTAIVWNDGSKTTTVHCGKDEEFEEYAGFCAAIVKKLFESTSAAKKFMEEKDVKRAKARKEALRQKRLEETRAIEAKNRAKKEAAEQKVIKKFVDQVMSCMASELDLSSQEDDGK